MPRPGTTAERGYGAEHAAEARRLKAAMRDGDPCCRCGGPMYRWQLKLDRNDIDGIDADHHGQARALGGRLPDALAHRRCNRRAGARLGNRLRGAARRPRRARELPEW
jgi:hypothetical protein